MRRILTATMLGALLAAPALPADANQAWLNDGRWQVWQHTLDGGPTACFLKTQVPTSAGYATFGLSQTADRNAGTFHYSEDGIRWIVPKGRVYFRIDGGRQWFGDTEGISDAGNGLWISLGESPGPFLAELAGGYMLHITTDGGTRDFPLAGSGFAIARLMSCVAAISGSAGPPTAQLPPARIPSVPLPAAREFSPAGGGMRL